MLWHNFHTVLLTGLLACTYALPDHALEERQAATGPPPGAALRIIPIGDSLTTGYYARHGYRSYLYYLLQSAGFTVSTVGANIDTNAPLLAANLQRNEGYPGRRILEIQYNLGSSRSLAQHPNIGLLMAGTTDVGSGSDFASAAPGRLGGLIDYCFQLNPSMVLYVAKLTPALRYQNEIDTYNAQIPSVVQQRAAKGFKIRLVDMSTIPRNNDTLDGDNIHLKEAGYYDMAQIWYKGIQATPRNLFTVPPQAPGT